MQLAFFLGQIQPAENGSARTTKAGSESFHWLDANTYIDAILNNWEAWSWMAAKIGVAVLIGLVIHAIVFFVLKRIVNRTRFSVDDLFFKRIKRPSRLIFPLLAIQATLSTMEAELTPGQMEFLRHLISLAAIAAITWLGVAMVNATEEFVKTRHKVDVADNYAARRIHTQLTVLSRTIVVFVVILGVAAMLMTFPRVREFGASILVSAGFAGLAIGLAARPVLENLIAGLQIALTQPINLDDVVIISGEWGRIEEIRSTYVVVRIWDQRRLIVPFSKIINEPFQNWTRKSADILGTVFIYADYTVPFQAVREELERLTKQHEKWDGRVCVLQITDAKESTVEIRALVSAANAGDAWDLRVWLREKLIEFLQREYPQCLPRTRVELHERPERAPDGERRRKDRESEIVDTSAMASADDTIGKDKTPEEIERDQS